MQFHTGQQNHITHSQKIQIFTPYGTQIQCYIYLYYIWYYYRKLNNARTIMLVYTFLKLMYHVQHCSMFTMQYGAYSMSHEQCSSLCMQSARVIQTTQYHWAHWYNGQSKLLGYAHIATKGSVNVLVMGVTTNQKQHAWHIMLSFPLCIYCRW